MPRNFSPAPFSWCDLRWGISNFKSENVLRLCLNGIEDCDPFFVGLLGNYYGSIPKKLSKKQKDALCDKFPGLRELISSHLSFTDIEMRYYLLNKQSKTDLCLFYFTKDNNDYSPSSIYQKLNFFLTNFWNNRINKIDVKLKKWQEDIVDDKFTISKEIDNFWSKSGNLNLENTAITDLTNCIVNKFPTNNHPNLELILNEQVYYYELLNKKYFSIGYDDIYIKINEWLSKSSNEDCAMIWGLPNTGKTQIATHILRQCENSDHIVLFYYVGASRSEDTPLYIMRSILYQLCRTLDLDFDKYVAIKDVDKIKEILYSIFKDVKRNIVVLIDGIGPKILSSREMLNSFISWIPLKCDNVKYIFSSERILPNNGRVENFEVKINQSVIYSFMKEYLASEYLISDGKLEKKFNDNNFLFSDLNDIKTTIDEILIGNIKNSEKINNIKLDPQVSVYTRIDSILSNNKYLKGNQEQEIRKGLIFLSLSEYGIFEVDVYSLFSDKQTWTILYSYIYPYLSSKGRIGLSNSISTVFLNNTENLDQYRLALSNWLNIINKDNDYTLEIISQYSKMTDKMYLLKYISNANILFYLLDVDQDKLSYYLLQIENNFGLLELNNHIEEDLDKEYADDILKKIVFYLKITNFYIEVLPRYNYALHYIEKSEMITKENILTNQVNDDVYISKVNVLTAMCRFKEAKQILDSSLIKNSSKELILRAKIYDNDYQSKKERNQAIDIYLQIIEQNNLDSYDLYLTALNRICRLQGVINVKDNEKYIEKFNQIFYNHIPPGSHLYYKHLPEKEVLSLFMNGFQGTKVGTEEEMKFFDTIKDIHKQIHESYSHSLGSCIEECNCLLLLKELIDKKTDIYEKRNDFDNHKQCVKESFNYAKDYHDLMITVYRPDSLEYALATFTLSNSFKDLALVEPFNKVENLEKALEYSRISENIWDNAHMNDHILKAKLYHNRAYILLELNKYKDALLIIRKSIKIKENICNENEMSLFDSYMRELYVLNRMIIWGIGDYNCNINDFKKRLSLTIDKIKELNNEIFEEKLDVLYNYQKFLEKSEYSNSMAQCLYILGNCAFMAREIAQMLKEKTSELVNKDLDFYFTMWENENLKFHKMLEDKGLLSTFDEKFPKYKEYKETYKELHLIKEERKKDVMQMKDLLELADRIISNVSSYNYDIFRRR